MEEADASNRPDVTGRQQFRTEPILVGGFEKLLAA
jgi:hypothetical protein